MENNEMRNMMLASVKTTPSGCWKWSGKDADRIAIKTNFDTYGQQKYMRLAYYGIFKESPITNQSRITLECKNGWCINPGHMKLTTRYQEMLDLIVVDSETNCWLWQGSKIEGGYGTFWIDGKPQPVHRYLYRKFIGEIPDGMQLCHKCDVRECCNPDHMFIGTQKDNMIDMVRKGRCKTVLNSAIAIDIIELAKAGIIYKEIAKHVGVSSWHVSNVVNGLSWAHATGIDKNNKPIALRRKNRKGVHLSHSSLYYKDEKRLYNPFC